MTPTQIAAVRRKLALDLFDALDAIEAEINGKSDAGWSSNLKPLRLELAGGRVDRAWREVEDFQQHEGDAWAARRLKDVALGANALAKRLTWEQEGQAEYSPVARQRMVEDLLKAVRIARQQVSHWAPRSSEVAHAA